MPDASPYKINRSPCGAVADAGAGDRAEARGFCRSHRLCSLAGSHFTAEDRHRTRYVTCLALYCIQGGG